MAQRTLKTATLWRARNSSCHRGSRDPRRHRALGDGRARADQPRSLGARSRRVRRADWLFRRRSLLCRRGRARSPCSPRAPRRDRRASDGSRHPYRREGSRRAARQRGRRRRGDPAGRRRDLRRGGPGSVADGRAGDRSYRRPSGAGCAREINRGTISAPRPDLDRAVAGSGPSCSGGFAGAGAVLRAAGSAVIFGAGRVRRSGGGASGVSASRETTRRWPGFLAAAHGRAGAVRDGRG